MRLHTQTSTRCVWLENAFGRDDVKRRPPHDLLNYSKYEFLLIIAWGSNQQQTKLHFFLYNFFSPNKIVTYFFIHYESTPNPKYK